MALKLTGLSPLISVYDMPRAVAFYRDVLGFEVVASSPEVEAPEGRYFHWAMLRLGGAELMLNTAYDAGERPVVMDEPRWEGHGDTCLYIGCPDVEAAFAELAAKGLPVTPPTVAPYGMKQLYVRDPDGYQLCFQSRA
ncbi:MAG: VOC family protein [Proteobacteria bacterium]|nr:VOC family protein [Pseudomonadota bacterium]